MGDNGYTAPTGRGRPQVVGNVLQVVGPINITVWFGDVGTFGGNGEEGRKGTYRLPQADHREASAEDSRWDVGDSQGGSSTGSGRNEVGDDLYRDTAGNCDTVGGFTTDIRSACRGEGLRGVWTQEVFLVAPRGNRETTLRHIGRIITGS